MVLSRFSRFLNLIDFQHSIFGLPFAYLGAFLALPGFPGWSNLFWITIAMIGARTAALCMNRAIDVHIDAKNPRTVDWSLVKGEFSLKLTWGVALLSLFVLGVAAWQLNPLCLILSPLAIFALWGYSYTKRFTWWCHLFLGLAIGMGPMGGWIAVTGQIDWQPMLLTMAVAFWVAGFDIMYACQDIEFDRQEGLFSIPARFGIRGALMFARTFHFLTFIFFVFAGAAMGMGWPYYLGVGVAGIILVYEHTLINTDNLNLVNLAAFKINHYVAPIIFAMALLDIFLVG
ncbi:MAG: UbiA family prenyltransferase [Syntrophomonadaceae bacterium]|nr:UbiA family prenyltransferase [Syntrophomonadaceae bacterium]